MMTLTPTTAVMSAPVALDKPHAALKKATEQFETYFLHQLLQEMRKTVPKDPLLKDDGDQQQIFQDMLDQRLSESIASRGDFGMGRMLYDQLKGSVGGATPPATVDVRR